ncbi:MAG: hypothetical protein ACD_73C00783G0004 [uncultured bacterium]|nr:MAG: hypothetical protein ACD_73C00783G0004 [uncultured bacterium]
MASQKNVLKVGLFVLIVFLLLVYATVRISKSGFSPGGNYSVYVLIESAAGLNKKTPVQIAGVQVGAVKDIRLIENNKAELELTIKKSVKLSANVEARIKSIGFLGDTYIELYQPGPMTQTLVEGSRIETVQNFGDFNSVTQQVGAIADDVKAITQTMRTLMAGEDSSFARSLKNIEKITDSLGRLSTNNEQNIQVIITNLRALSENMNAIVARNAGNVNATLDNVQVITDKMRKGEGTLGRLINDDATVDKLNESIDSLNDLLGGPSKMKIDVGYHTEYLGSTQEFKHYVGLDIKPKPDKFLRLELVQDPSPSPSRIEKNTTITSGGVTSTVNEEIATINSNKFRFTAELGKKFYDLTIRGGLIESSGGVGLDYNKGPVGLQFSAFNFVTKFGEHPHLKAMGTINLTPSLYALGGMDDFLNTQHGKDWFMGLGFNITDDDIKSFFGLLSLKP